VYRRLKHDIVTCALPPGNSLSEQDLCRRYHTSRTPIREACHHLEKDGLIKIVPYRGYFVASLTMAEYHGLNELQMIVEPATAALAAQRATPEQAKQIQKLAEYGYRVGDQKSYYDFLERNYRFHVAIAEAASNESLLKVVSEVHTRLMRFFFLVISVDAYGPKLVAEHCAIAKAVTGHDPERARQRSVEHIVRTMQRSANLLLNATPSRFDFLAQSAGLPASLESPLGDWRRSVLETFLKDSALARPAGKARKPRRVRDS
jgi:DNA-binding GntR family transcriptional regulator